MKANRSPCVRHIGHAESPPQQRSDDTGDPSKNSGLSRLSASQLAARHGISKATVLTWKTRDSIEDLPHTPHNFSNTMSDLKEFVVIERRTSLLLAIDEQMCC